MEKERDQVGASVRERERDGRENKEREDRENGENGENKEERKSVNSFRTLLPSSWDHFF